MCKSEGPDIKFLISQDNEWILEEKDETQPRVTSTTFMHLVRQVVIRSGLVSFISYIIFIPIIYFISLNDYYLQSFLSVACIDLFLWIYCVISIHISPVSIDDLNLGSYVSTDSICFACTYGMKYPLYIRRWRNGRWWIAIIFGLCSIPAFALYMDATSPPVNSSSCTTTNSASETTNFFNPNGYFGGRRGEYSDAFIGVFCTMYQKYAFPTKEEYVSGYDTSPIAVQKCTTMANPSHYSSILSSRINGYADTVFCKDNDPSAYPSPVYGLPVPVHASTKNINFQLCEGNNLGINACVDEDGSNPRYQGASDTCPVLLKGAPKVICSTCLQYYRMVTGDYTGPPGYEFCSPYIDGIGTNFFCYFCPGLGNDKLAFSDAKYDANTLLVIMILTIVFLVFQIIECMVFFIYGNRVYRKCIAKIKQEL